MWQTVESGSMPTEIDDTSSEVYVYIRKNIEKVEDEEKGTYYTYLEQKIKKEDWDMYRQILTNTSDLSDIQDALVELAEMVVG